MLAHAHCGTEPTVSPGGVGTGQAGRGGEEEAGSPPGAQDWVERLRKVDIREHGVRSHVAAGQVTGGCGEEQRAGVLPRAILMPEEDRFQAVCG